MIGLSNGTITDDSDVWVFGGLTVYKNFFNQDKHCEKFSAQEIGQHFGLSREKMILIGTVPNYRNNLYLFNDISYSNVDRKRLHRRN